MSANADRQSTLARGAQTVDLSHTRTLSSGIPNLKLDREAIVQADSLRQERSWRFHTATHAHKQQRHSVVSTSALARAYDQRSRRHASRNGAVLNERQ